MDRLSSRSEIVLGVLKLEDGSLLLLGFCHLGLKIVLEHVAVGAPGGHVHWDLLQWDQERFVALVLDVSNVLVFVVLVHDLLARHQRLWLGHRRLSRIV